MAEYKTGPVSVDSPSPEEGRPDLSPAAPYVL